jgi:alcohol dehydrogenase (cytochrome c)
MGLGGAGGAVFSYGANIDAIDYKTGKIVWRHATEGSVGLRTTAGKLLVSGDGNYLVALEPATGKTLWHTKIGAAGNAPETYLLDGHPYLLAPRGISYLLSC